MAGIATHQLDDVPRRNSIENRSVNARQEPPIIPGFQEAVEESEPQSRSDRAAGAEIKRAPMHRLNINLPKSLHDDLCGLARQMGRSITDVVRLGLGLVYIAYTELRPGYRLAICDQDGRPVKELLLPL
jgi:hypothetical protein